tara:strand:+ start:943 stop:1314 length:372 start_codon:yes stop_codon:yes gene_type:complete
MAITLSELPRYSTNLDFVHPYGGSKPNYKVLIKVTDVSFDTSNDCGEPEPSEEEREELENEFIGTILKFDLDGFTEYYSPNEFDSEYHFLSEHLDECLADRISDETGWLVNYANWVEVEEVQN